MKLSFQPLKTKFKGVQYKSRTEARWAAFFTAAKIPFAYEPEGVDLGPLGWYLPDFALYPHSRAPMFAEVKFGAFTDSETAKCEALCQKTGLAVVMLDGPPALKVYDIFEVREEYSCRDEDECGRHTKNGCCCQKNTEVSKLNGILCTGECNHNPFFYYAGFEDDRGYFRADDWYPEHAEAVLFAQNEEFKS